VKSGKLKHRITIQRPVETQDATTGETTVTWRAVCYVWAAIEPLSAKEFIAAQATQSQVMARIVIRYRDDVTPKMRAVHGEKIYNIHGVLADLNSGREYLTLPVSEGVNDG